MNPIWIVLPILTLLMFELGLTLDLHGFSLLLRRPLPVIVGLVGQIIVLPLLAFFLGWLFGLESILFLGLVLIACSPGGSSSNVFTMLARGDLPLSILLTAFSSIITLVTIPIVMSLALRFIGDQDGITIQLPIGRLIAQNLLLVLLPVILGALLRWRGALVADRIHRILSRIALPAIILLATIFFIQHHQTIVSEFSNLAPSIAALILLAILAGWLLARFSGLGTTIRRTLVIEIGMQNAAQAIAIATSPFIFACDRMAIPAILYALLMNVILLSYLALLRWRGVIS